MYPIGRQLVSNSGLGHGLAWTWLRRAIDSYSAERRRHAPAEFAEAGRQVDLVGILASRACFGLTVSPTSSKKRQRRDVPAHSSIVPAAVEHLHAPLFGSDSNRRGVPEERGAPGVGDAQDGRRPARTCAQRAHGSPEQQSERNEALQKSRMHEYWDAPDHLPGGDGLQRGVDGKAGQRQAREPCSIPARSTPGKL